MDAPEQRWPLLLNNDAVLSHVQLEATGVDAVQARTGIALPIALGLIESIDRDVRLSAPITVEAGGKIEFGELVRAAISRAIEGGLSWPLKVLGDLFRGKQAPYAFAIQPVPFEEGKGSLDRNGTRRVTEIARVLSAHPFLTVILQAQVTPAEIVAVGESAANDLARARLEAVTAAITSTAAVVYVEAARLVPAQWSTKVAAEATNRPGVYIEIQRQ